ncbi:NAD(P)/FAD-dependent oxidoreductase [Rarobacter faecitabidus]|uniref:NADH:ubiquinone reductase (non-electrogenic) n=1 Tax=Rarobacter faecitabidus TaxID=13243 RepID=A0A542ZAY0_RARFA|nr:NAD(P)/FAD-dependent oxidoreductase [Rarobacter faecitabidus]TQL57400.1 NADH dehydrogenase [Rarobacter faecitabidus]
MNSSPNAASADSRRKHVIVVGGGFAGVAAVRALRRSNVRVTLIDRHIYNMFQPLLYQVATAGLNPGDVTYFLRALRYRQKNVNYRQGLLASVDTENRSITLRDGGQLSYDYLILANGVTTNYLSTPGARTYAKAIYTRSQALRIRDLVFRHLEEAAATPETVDGLRVVIVGGGATGVEMAGALAELRNQGLFFAYPEIEHDHIQVTLVQRSSELLKPFSKRLRSYARRSLEKRGVDLRFGQGVREVHADCVELNDGTRIPADLVVWAAGVTAHSEVAEWGFEQGWGGRIVVDEKMRVKGQESEFAIGDIALNDLDLPQLAQPAIQAGRYVGRLITDDMAGKSSKPFRYRDKGTMATIGRRAAVAEIKGIPPLTGPFAWYSWAVVHIFQLLGGRNRLATFANLVTRYGQFWRVHPNPIIGELRPARIYGVEPEQGRRAS